METQSCVQMPWKKWSNPASPTDLKNFTFSTWHYSKFLPPWEQMADLLPIRSSKIGRRSAICSHSASNLDLASLPCASNRWLWIGAPQLSHCGSRLHSQQVSVLGQPLNGILWRCIPSRITVSSGLRSAGSHFFDNRMAARNSFFTTHQIFARGRGWKTHHSVASVTKHCSPQRHTATCSTILPTFLLSTRSKSSYMDRNRSMACEQHCNAQTHTGLFSGGRAAARPPPQPSTFQSLPFQVVELIYDPVQLSKHFLQKKPQLFRVTEEMPFNCACKQTMSWASNCNKM